MRAYYTRRPDLSVREQRVMFGTSGHRGSALDGAFKHRTDGPLFLGIDTHALSVAALASAIEVLGACGGRLRLISTVEDPGEIREVLADLARSARARGSRSAFPQVIRCQPCR